MNKACRAAAVWAAVLGAGVCLAAEPSVTNVRAEQRRGTALVDITYDLADADTAALSVTAAVSTNGGAAFFTPAGGLSGDLGSVARGAGRTIVWNAGDALPPKLYHNVKARVTASDNPAPEGMALIPAGSFSMGDSYTEGDSGERPVHTVYVSSFYMDCYEVTKAQWDAVYTWAVANGYGFGYAGSGKASDHPVQTVSWYDCVKWCNARSQKEGLAVCYTVGGATYKTGSVEPDCNWSAGGYRLPTEAEWEKAARGGTDGQRFPWGGTITHSQANYYSNSSYAHDTSPTRGYHPTYNDGTMPYTSPVGAFAPNGYGLYDMVGNVWEWCWDWYGSAYYRDSPGSDPRGRWLGYYRVIRGGSYGNTAYCGRVAYRDDYYGRPTLSNYYSGFRSVRIAP